MSKFNIFPKSLKGDYDLLTNTANIQTDSSEIDTNDINITGGSINGVIIGNSNPSDAYFTNLYLPSTNHTTTLNVWTGGGSLISNPTLNIKLLKIGNIVTLCVSSFIFSVLNTVYINITNKLPIGFRPSTSISSHSRITENTSYSNLIDILPNGDILVYGNLNGDGFNGGSGTSYTINGFSVSYSI